MFGSNLRHLAKAYPSISELARQLGINRTQFNRYLAGESFPRPDVLARICDFFGVDARVLLEPVDDLARPGGVLSGPELASFLGPAEALPEQSFPSGFYAFTRRSFIAADRFAMGLVLVWRNADGQCFVRGYEAREAMNQQGLRMSPKMREFRGAVLRIESGVAALISRRKTLTATFNFLHPVPSFENNFWVGYVARTTPEAVDGHRVARMVYEHLGRDLGRALQVARSAGLVEAAGIPGYHQRLLQADMPFR